MAVFIAWVAGSSLPGSGGRPVSRRLPGAGAVNSSCTRGLSTARRGDLRQKGSIQAARGLAWKSRKAFSQHGEGLSVYSSKTRSRPEAGLIRCCGPAPGSGVYSAAADMLCSTFARSALPVVDSRIGWIAHRGLPLAVCRRVGGEPFRLSPPPQAEGSPKEYKVVRRTVNRGVFSAISKHANTGMSEKVTLIGCFFPGSVPWIGLR